MTPQPVVIDCDPGIDDALALMLAAASSELELLGVTCVAGNRPLETTAANACRVLDAAGQRAVPVHAGCARPMTQELPRCNLVHGEDGLGGVTLASERGPSRLHAVDFLEHTLEQSATGSVVVVAIGPLTNLALLEAKRPGMLRRARSLLVMGGAAFCPGNVTPSAEFNFHADPLAAQVVLGAGAAVKLFGLDVTRQAAMPAGWIASLAELGTGCGAAAHAMLQAYAQRDPLLHDACPVAWLLAPELFSSERCPVSVDWRPGATAGHLSAWRKPGGIGVGEADVFTAVDTARLLALMRQRLGLLP